MHYYTHNFGDYSKDAGHLTTLQHGIYRLLMDAYYVTEQPIPVKKAARIARAPQEDVDVVLNDFFVMSEDGTVWRHKRIDAEIAAYHAKAEKNRVNGALGGRPPKEGKPSGLNLGSGSDSERKPKQKANRKPETKNQVEPPNSPQRGPITLATFLTSLAGENAFKPGDAAFKYADSIGLPAIFLKLAWLEMQQRVSPNKKYTDWRKAFLNYVRGNFLKLWYEDGDSWSLTVAGKQAWKVHMGDEL